MGRGQVLKPKGCRSCALFQRGQGFVKPEVNPDALIMLVGDAPVEQEALEGRPFIGPAGEQLNRALRRVGLPRGAVQIGNCIQCRPPNNWLSGSPWEEAALSSCRTYREALINKEARTKVYVALGTIATKTILEDNGQHYAGKLENWHSTVTRLADEQYMIPTFHPSYLLQGKQNLFNAQCFALRLAMEVAAFGYIADPLDLIVDPPQDWFETYVDETVKFTSSWLAVDIETAISVGEAEDELPFPIGEITRINFSAAPDYGITVPWESRYLPSIHRLLSSPMTKVFWNERFDVPILTRNDSKIGGTVVDMMQGWHMLQPNLPMGLGFVSPFYSKIGPWKHMAQDNIGKYAAIDAAATIRCALGISKDLVEAEQWDSFMRYMVHLDQRVLHPAETEGLMLDMQEIKKLQQELQVELSAVSNAIDRQVPKEARPRAGGWKRDPRASYPEAYQMVVEEDVFCCDICGEVDVTAKHNCEKR